MKISLNTVKEYTNIDWDTPELIDKISGRLGAVEGYENLGEMYGESYVVRVVKAEKHPNADKLSVCLIDDNGANKNVERNSDGLVEVVCGAPNVKTGMLAVWLPPGATVPSSIASGDPFVLSARPLRGVTSHGMLASMAEMSLGDDHSGIIDITNEEVEVGGSFTEAFGLNDLILEIENKMFTHRPDCFGLLGIAREVAGIQHKQFSSPNWYSAEPEFETSDQLSLTIGNEAGDKVPRFMGVALDEVQVAPSPMWLKVFLAKQGVHSVNNVVDITNYVMLLAAQPMHAYDYSKVAGASLTSRFAKSGEEVKLLNGKDYKLQEDDIVIADANGAVGVAGIMGGIGTEVQSDTSQIILEVANFDMYAVRKTSMRHGLFTDALTRFNKGQSPLQTDRAINLAIELLEKYAGAKVASRVEDIKTNLDEIKQPVKLEVGFINERLGLELTASEAADLLINVEFAVEVEGDSISVTPPFWRTDIEIKEDVVEEVGRLYGFDRLRRELPVAPTTPVEENQQRKLRQDLRNILSGMGGNEVLTYSFVHERVLKAANQPVGRAFKITNALSPDLQHYRLTVLPSLLDKVHANVKAGFSSFMIYEFGKGHDIEGSYTEDLPDEPQYLDIVYTSTKSQKGAAFYVARSVVDQLSAKLGVDIVVSPVESSDQSLVLRPLHSKRRAVITTSEGRLLGYIGEIALSTRREFKLPDYTAAVSINLDVLEEVVRQAGSRYVPLSRFPSVYRDVSLKTSLDVTTLEIEQVAKQAIEEATAGTETVIKFEVTSLFKPDDAETRNTTLHFTLTPYGDTLKGEDVTELMDKITSKLTQELSGEVV